MTTFKIPQRIFFAVATSRIFPDGFFCGDYEENLDDVLDHALDNKRPFRVFQLEFDPDSNMPEAIRDVTEDALRERADWLRKQGRSEAADEIEAA